MYRYSSIRFELCWTRRKSRPCVCADLFLCAATVETGDQVRLAYDAVKTTDEARGRTDIDGDDWMLW